MGGVGDNNYPARFKFLIFDLATGFRTGSEVVTKDIVVTGPDTFEATSTYDFFDGEGTLLASGCIINETGTRF
jgi:hypothetical protein